eukprot:6189921-Pleurochrysis_carterae.AAC.1
MHPGVSSQPFRQRMGVLFQAVVSFAALTDTAAYSQGFQDLRLRRLLQELKMDSPVGNFYVEFGWRSLFGANTHVLSARGWEGIRFDGTRRIVHEKVRRAFITEDSVVPLFRKHEVPLNVTYLSIDVDTTDIWILDAILSSEYKPAILTIEYNSNYPWGYPIAFPSLVQEQLPEAVRTWDGSCYMGSSAMAIAIVAEQHGYAVVDVEPGLDLYLVRRELWGSRFVPDLAKVPYLHRLININYKNSSMDAAHIGALVDYSEFAKSRSFERARQGVPAMIERLREEKNECFVDGPPCTQYYFDNALYSRRCVSFGPAERARWLPIGSRPRGLRTYSAWRPNDFAKLADGSWRADVSCVGADCEPELTPVSLKSRTGLKPSTSKERYCCKVLAMSRDDPCPDKPDGICRTERYKSAWHQIY